MDPSFYEKETVSSLPYSKYMVENRNAFLKKLVKISEDLGIQPIWLLHTIFHNSKFDSGKIDRQTGAVGILSFFPEVVKEFIDTETGKNITSNDIIEMSNIDQLDLVHSIYKSWIDNLSLDKPLIAGDFAALTFYPAVIKKDWEWEFPDYIMEKNRDMFNNFPIPGDKTKKNYYDYIDQIFRNEDEFTDVNDSILGQLRGVFVSPGLFRTKKPLEYYKNLVELKEDPYMEKEIQKQDTESTETHKQKE